MKILLTGATGFLGSHIAEALLANDVNLMITKRSMSSLNNCTSFIDHVQVINSDNPIWISQALSLIHILNLDPAAVILNDDCFAVGTKVQVIKGDFCGVEGELASLSNRTYVTIRIRGVLSASVKVPKSYLRILAP